MFDIVKYKTFDSSLEKKCFITDYDTYNISMTTGKNIVIKCIKVL